MTPLFALRQEADHGIGDLGALKKLIDWCHEVGLRFILLLPVTACGRDYSPYNAISSFALEPLYLDLHDEELFSSLGGNIPNIPRSIDGVSTEFVDYEKVANFKHTFLYEIFLRTSGNVELQKFVLRNRSWLDAYALFCALAEKFQSTDFHLWPEEFRSFSHAKSTVDTSLLQRMAYQQFCQWICDKSWRRIQQYAKRRKVLLIGDLPFSISQQSADYWQNPQQFSEKWYAGAPPEPSFQDDEFVRRWGQNWGLPVYNWKKEEKRNFPWLRKRLRRMSRFFHGIRLDHALGYFRVFAFPWHPSQNPKYLDKTPEEVLAKGGEIPRFFPAPDDSQENQQRNRENGYRILSFLKKTLPRRLLIAEDLGLVPDYVRPVLEELKIPGMKVPYFERLPPDLSYLPVEEYPECSLATWATHDHPPLAALWKKWQQSRSHSDAMNWEVRCFLRFLSIEQDRTELEMPEDIHLAAIRKISESRSAMLCLQLTDWFKLQIRYNHPGTLSVTNWSARLPFTVEELFKNHSLTYKTNQIREILRQTLRINMPN